MLRFWFPTERPADRTAMVRQAEWWFRGGADAQIIERFSALLERAARGEIDSWSREPRSRLALVIVLDQFSRSVYRGTARTYAQDAKARGLVREGLETGHYSRLGTAFEKTFFLLPLGHSEDLTDLESAIELAHGLIDEAPPEHRWWFEFSASQARGQRGVVARFGRHPHRNEILGRASTAEELEFLARGELVHTRPMPR